MRKVIYFLIITFLLPSTLWAADPIIGTWKLNLEKAERQIDGQYKELTEIYEDIGLGQIELTRTGVQINGSQIITKHTWPQQGGVAKGKVENRIIVELLVASGEWYAIWLIEGKQVAFIHKVISKDGKTMYQTINGVGPQGQPVQNKSVFDRQ